MKKLFAVLTAAVMALSLCTTALADEPQAPLTTSPQPEAGEVSLIDAVKASLPYDGVNIWLDGKYMTFEDAVPAVVDGRTQAPYRAVLEAMGAEVTYDEGDIKANFEDGSVMELAIGSKTMTFTKDGVVKTVEMDVAPYIDQASGRTFVPVRFIGEALGLTVTWSEDIWVAYIVDWDALEAEIDQKFTKINEMLALPTSQVDESKNYKSVEEIVISGLLAGQEKVDPLKLTIKGESIESAEALSGKYTLGIDLGGYKTTIEAMGEEVMAAIDALDGTELEAIVEADGGIFVRSSLLTALTSGLVPENGWLSVDLAGLYEGMGIDFEQLLQEASSAEMTMGGLVRMLCEDGTFAEAMGYMAPEQAAGYFTAIYEGIFGDDCITISKSGPTTTYTCKATAKTIFGGLAETGLVTEEEVKEITDLMTFDFEMGLSVRNEKLINSTVKMNIEVEGVKMTMDISGDDFNAEGVVAIEIAEVGSLEVEISVEMTETSEQPLTQPSEGDDVVTIEELMSHPSAAQQAA